MIDVLKKENMPLRNSYPEKMMMSLWRDIMVLGMKLENMKI